MQRVGFYGIKKILGKGKGGEVIFFNIFYYFLKIKNERKV